MALEKHLRKGILAAAALASVTALYAEEAKAYEDDWYVAEQLQDTNVYPDEYRLITLASILVLDGPVKCGLGALINDTDFGECIAPALFGGLIDYMGLEIAQYNGTPFVGGTGKLIHDFGVSIADNAAAGLPMFDRFQTDFGPFLFSAEHLTTEPEFNVYFQIAPVVGIITNFAEGNRFEFLDTLSNLTPVFSFENVTMEHMWSRVAGYTMGNVMTYGRGENVESYDSITVRSHEFDHVLMYSGFRFINDLLPAYPMEKLHLSFGPDMGWVVMALPPALCRMFTEDCYDVYMATPLEFFAYTMQND
ncbi:MAG TPA: hypothetical protein HA362_01985 [Nanoarchaeota archaeon]|nr:hypothetical protein [Nanoarchaeota archaeon]